MTCKSEAGEQIYSPSSKEKKCHPSFILMAFSQYGRWLRQQFPGCPHSQVLIFNVSELCVCSWTTRQHLYPFLLSASWDWETIWLWWWWLVHSIKSHTVNAQRRRQRTSSTFLWALLRTETAAAEEHQDKSDIIATVTRALSARCSSSQRDAALSLHHSHLLL